MDRHGQLFSEVSVMASAEETAFRSEMVTLLPRLRRFGCSLSGGMETADELVQAACERALQRFHQWQPGTRLDSWLFSIMHSIWCNELKSRKVRLGRGQIDADKLADAGVESHLGDRLMLSKVDRIVGQLPEEQRAVLLLVCAEGYSYKEAAESLGVPIGTVMSRLARARLAVTERLHGAASGELRGPSQLSGGGA
jgi:RNA polymerase sigma-70 factor (ECF subfamily)